MVGTALLLQERYLVAGVSLLWNDHFRPPIFGKGSVWTQSKHPGSIIRSSSFWNSRRDRQFDQAMPAEGSQRQAQCWGTAQQWILEEEIQRMQAENNGEESYERKRSQIGLQTHPKINKLERYLRGQQSSPPSQQLFHSIKRVKIIPKKKEKKHQQKVNIASSHNVQYLQPETAKSS